MNSTGTYTQRKACSVRLISTPVGGCWCSRNRPRIVTYVRLMIRLDRLVECRYFHAFYVLVPPLAIDTEIRHALDGAIRGPPALQMIKYK